MVLRLTYELVLNLISCWQLVGLGGLRRQADDLIGLLYLGQHYLGNGWQVLQAGVEKGVGRVARKGRSDLQRRNGQEIVGGINFYATSFKTCQMNTQCLANKILGWFGHGSVHANIFNNNNDINSLCCLLYADVYYKTLYMKATKKQHNRLKRSRKPLRNLFYVLLWNILG